MGASHGAGRPGRLHQAARRAHLSLRQGSRKIWSSASRCTLPRRIRSPLAPCRCWSRATSSAPSRSMAIPSTLQRTAPPMSSTQGTLLDLYDPDRSQHVTYRRREPRVGRVCAGAPREGCGKQRRHRHLLPRDHHFAHAGAAVEGSAGRISEGEAGAVRPGASPAPLLAKGYNVQYDLERCGCDRLARCGLLSGAAYPGFHKLVARVREAAQGSRQRMNRLYAIESTPTTTGMKAEHRLGLRASEIPAFAAAAGQGCRASRASTLRSTRGLTSSRSFSPPSPRI